MNPLENRHLHVPQPINHQLVDRLRLSYYLPVGRRRLMNLSAGAGHRISIRRLVPLSKNRWIEAGQESP